MVRILNDDAITRRDIDRVLSERQWLPLYNQHGPFDEQLIYSLPIERQYPPDKAQDISLHKQLTLDDLTKTMREFRAKHGRPLRAIKISDETMRLIEQAVPMYPSQGRATTLYSVPVHIDNNLEPFECEPVYA